MVLRAAPSVCGVPVLRADGVSNIAAVTGGIVRKGGGGCEEGRLTVGQPRRHQRLDYLERTRGCVACVVRRRRDVHADGDVLQRRRRIEQAVVDLAERGIVIWLDVRHHRLEARGTWSIGCLALTILDGIPEGGAVLLGQAHDLLCVSVADKVGFLGRVGEGVGNVPLRAVTHNQPPWQGGGLVQVDQQADGQVAQLDLLVVEARAGHAVVGGQAGEQQSQVTEARHRHDEWGGRPGDVGDAQGHLQAP